MTARAGSIEPFPIEVPEAAIEDLRCRLDHTGWPAQSDGDDWTYGVDSEFMRGLCGYWAGGRGRSH
jgi:microsomal epoxide hydrolase